MIALLLAVTTGDLSLVCRGTSLRSVPIEHVRAQAETNYGASATGKATRTGVVEQPMTVSFRMTGGAGEMFVPIFGRWLPVKKLAVTDAEITGKVQTALLASSSFRVDRVTGEMTSSGGFRGRCEPAPIERKF